MAEEGQKQEEVRKPFALPEKAGLGVGAAAQHIERLQKMVIMPRIDTNSDGKIDLEQELISVLDRNPDLAGPMLALYESVMQKAPDGQVSTAALARAMSDHLFATNQKLDANQDGIVSADEITGYAGETDTGDLKGVPLINYQRLNGLNPMFETFVRELAGNNGLIDNAVFATAMSDSHNYNIDREQLGEAIAKVKTLEDKVAGGDNSPETAAALKDASSAQILRDAKSSILHGVMEAGMISPETRASLVTKHQVSQAEMNEIYNSQFITKEVSKAFEAKDTNKDGYTSSAELTAKAATDLPEKPILRAIPIEGPER